MDASRIAEIRARADAATAVKEHESKLTDGKNACGCRYTDGDMEPCKVLAALLDASWGSEKDVSDLLAEVERLRGMFQARENLEAGLGIDPHKLAQEVAEEAIHEADELRAVLLEAVTDLEHKPEWHGREWFHGVRAPHAGCIACRAAEVLKG